MQQGENMAFIDEILCNLSAIICDLSQPQVHVFYEACGKIISAEVKEGDVQTQHIERLMLLPNSVWDEIMQHAANVRLIYPEFKMNLFAECRKSS
jgi:exportin-1